MTAETVAKALGGRKAGGGWAARCPAHADRTPSLSIRDADDKKVLVFCHAGCDQERVVAALQRRGLLTGPGHERLPLTAQRAPAEHKSDKDDGGRSEAALGIWKSAMPARNARSRPISPRAVIDLPSIRTALRFHASLKHPSGGFYPTMPGARDKWRGGNRRWRSIALSSSAVASGKRKSIGPEDDARSLSWWRGASRG